MMGGMPIFDVSSGGVKKLKKDEWVSEFQPISPTQEQQSLLQWDMGDFQENSLNHFLEEVEEEEGFLSNTVGRKFGSISKPISLVSPKTLLYDSNHLDNHSKPISSLPISLPNDPFYENQKIQPLSSYSQQDEDQLWVGHVWEAVELAERGNLVQAQKILARLNHQLSPYGKPLQRAAFLFKEALQSLSLPRRITQLDIVHKINAFKAFSEVSPLVQFVNFSCNQSILEALDGYKYMHIIDFDIGFGVQWSSFMKDITRGGSIPSLKITAIISQSLHTTLELVLTQGNLYQYANDLGVPFEFNIVSFESLESLALHVSPSEAVAVNAPIGSYTSYLSPGLLVSSVLKQLSPKIIVSVDQECNRSDLPFTRIFQSYTVLLDSLDAVKVNLDIKHKIEKFIFQPRIERLMLGHQCCPTKMPDRTNIFSSARFSPITFSNISETQAEYVLRKLPVQGFHVEKRNVSLMLCWKRQQLVSVSAWRC